MRKICLALFIAAAVSLFSIPASAQEYFSDETAFFYYLQAANLSASDYALGYLSFTDPEAYKTNSANEAEFNTKKDSIVWSIKEKVSLLTPETVYFINASANFGEYDFNKQSFEFKPLNDRSFYRIVSFPSPQDPLKQVEVKISFSNPQVIKHIPMKKDKAQAFYKKRTDASGKIDKKVKMQIFFSVTGMAENAKDTLLCRITSAKIFANNDLLYAMTVAAPGSKAKAAPAPVAAAPAAAPATAQAPVPAPAPSEGTAQDSGAAAGAPAEAPKPAPTEDEQIAASELDDFITTRELPESIKSDLQKIVQKYSGKDQK